MNKRKKSAVAVYAIIAVVFILLTVLIPFRKSACSWIMFSFSIVSVIAGAGISLYAFGKPGDLMSKFYGYPLFRLGFIYTAVQIGMTVIIYLIDSIVATPYWVGLLLSILLAGFVSIGCIAADNARDYIEEMDVRTINTTKTISYFNIDINDIVDICENEDLLVPLQKLAQKFKYSDPVSVPETEEKEAQIKAELSILKDLITSNKTAEAEEKIKLITNLLSSRNRIKGSV